MIIDSASAGLKTDHNPCQVRGGNAEELDALHSDRGFVACRVHPGRSCPLPHPGGLQTPPSGPHLPCPFPRALPHHMTKLTLESWQRQLTGQDCRSSSLTTMSRCVLHSQTSVKTCALVVGDFIASTQKKFFVTSFAQGRQPLPDKMYSGSTCYCKI